MSRLVSVSGDGTGNDVATAMNVAQRNAQVVIIGQPANVLEHVTEAIGGVFTDVPTAPWPPIRMCLSRRNAFGGEGAA